MIQLLAAATLEDIDKAVGLIAEKLDTLIELLKGTQGNTQYYIAGVVSVTLIGAIGVLWKALDSQSKTHKIEMKEERDGAAAITKTLVDELRESGGETVKAIESKADSQAESVKLIAENTAALLNLKEAVEKISPPTTP